MKPRVKEMVDAILAEIPDLWIGETDYDCTVTVGNPQTNRAVYVARVFRDTRGEDPGYWEAKPASVPKIIARLREPNETKESAA